MQRLSLRDIEREMLDLYGLAASTLLARLHTVLSSMSNFPPHKYWLRHSHDLDADRARVYGETAANDAGRSASGSGVATVEHLCVGTRVGASHFDLEPVPNAVLQRLYLKTIKQTTTNRPLPKGTNKK